MLSIVLLYAELAKGAYGDSIYLSGFESRFISIGGTQVHVLTSEKNQLVIFRGTEKDSSDDILTDLKMMKSTAGTYGSMHQGFKKAYLLVHNQLCELLDPCKDTVFVGHSLGGALAIIAGREVPIGVELDNCRMPKRGVFTFGSPRVFDSEAAKYYRLNRTTVYRFENAGDPVPFAPPFFMGYRHVGKCFYLKAKKLIANPFSFMIYLDLFRTSNAQKLKSHSMQSYIDNIKGITAIP